MNNRNQWQQLHQSLAAVIVGQDVLLERLLIGLLAGGHVLLEGAPGLAKTTAVKVLSQAVSLDFVRIQFTPDLMPSDITGSEILDKDTGLMRFVQGPLFHQLTLADEINRAPPKVQSALLEAMAEGQVSVAGQTYPLDPLFFVVATQNPLEHSGTYPLPEAQMDRFMFHVRLDFPSEASELAILQKSRAGLLRSPKVDAVLTQAQLQAGRVAVDEIKMDVALQQYLVRLIAATRTPEQWDATLAGTVMVPASPRATLALAQAACARALIYGRDYATPEDIVVLLPDILRHRLHLSATARAMRLDVDGWVKRLLDVVPIVI
jgi:MoxR-like ATPase